MESGSVNHELLKYFDFDAQAQAPSLSAFYQQRAKLSDEVFQKLFYSFNRFICPSSLLKGRYQLLACDVSAVFTFTRNPKDAESCYVRSGRSQKGYNQMYLISLYDLLNKVYTDAVIQPLRKRNEFAAFYELTDRHTPCSGTILYSLPIEGYMWCYIKKKSTFNLYFFLI